MQQCRRPVPTPGRRRPSPSSPAPTDCRRDPCGPARSSWYPQQQPPAAAPPDHPKKRSSCSLLPLDLIRSILAKLPVRSILRFRSVCKSWKQLASEPTFVKLQVAEAATKPPRILVLTNHNFDSDPTNKIRLYAMEPLPLLLCETHLPSNESSTMMLPYDCDGLVLLYSKTDICVCNPTTGETLHLPGFSHGHPFFLDPVQSLGFGLDPLTNLCKVVHFFSHSVKYYNDDPRSVTWEVGCEVFTLGGGGGGGGGSKESQSWRQILNPTIYCLCSIKDSVSANGSIYWTVNNFSLLSNNFSLLSFDLGNEGIRQLLPPPAAMVYPPQNFPPIRIGDIFIIKGGAERLWFVKVNRDDITYDIWELTDETTHSWKSIHRIGFQMLATEPILAIPMLVIRNGRCIVLSNQEKLKRYDIVTKECKTMLTIEDAKEGDVNCVDGATLLCPSLYRETLVSFKTTNC